MSTDESVSLLAPGVRPQWPTWAPVPRRINAGFYIGFIVLGTFSSWLPYWWGELAPINISLELLLACIAISVAAVATHLVFIYRIWSAIQLVPHKITPGAAVGCLFIPIYNIYWIFKVYLGWARLYNQMIEHYGVASSRMTEDLPIYLCFLLLVVVVFQRIAMVAEASWVAPAYFLASLVEVTLLIAFVAKSARCVNNLGDELVRAGRQVA